MIVLRAPLPFRRCIACLALAACGLPALALDRSLTLAQLHHTAWSTRDGAPAQVESIAQTDDGLLWLGSATGLFRFDGVQFERFQPPPGQEGATGSVSTLLAPHDGGLWIGYRFGGIGWWNRGELRHFGRADGLPSGTVTAIERDAGGRVWVGTTTGLAVFDGQRWATPPQASTYPAGPTYALHEDRAGTLWAVAESGTWRLPRGGAHFERSTRSISYAWLAERADGSVWESNGTQGVWPLPSADSGPPLHAAVPGPGHVGPLRFDRDGVLWIGSLGGLTRLVDADRLPPLDADGTPHAEAAQRFGLDQGLSGDQVQAILEDREGSLWIATSGGIDRFRANKLTREPLPPDLLWPSLAPAAGEGVWAGSTEVAAARLGRDARRAPDVGPRITCAARDSKGGVWMAGARGVWRIDGNTALPVALPDNISGMPVQTMVDVGGGRMRLAIMRRGQWEQDAPPASGWHHVDEPPGGPDANPLAMARDPQGRLWLGYAFNRLVMISTDGSQRQWGVAEGLQIGSLLSMTAQDGRLWLGGELGLAAMEDGRVHPVRIAGREPLAGVSGIVADGAGNLWLNTVLGIVRLPAEELAQAIADPARAVAAERFDFHDGLDGAPAQLRPVPTAVAADDGKLWFATNNSVVWIDPAHIRRNALAPLVQILALNADGRSWPLPSPTLPAGTREVDLRFTAGSLAQPERVRFRVQLEGIDSAWHDTGPQRTAHYTNLAPGRYVFRVMAANEDGLWSAQPAAMNFVVPPTFSQTWWFRAMWLPIAGVLAWLLVRWRVRQLAQRYAERHEAILIERERIARELHDTLLQSVQGLILRFQSSVDRMPADDATRATLERSLDRAEKVLAEGRDRVTDLRAPAREDETLGELLERLGDDLAAEHGPLFSVTLHGEGAPLPDDVFDEAHHIGAEALANAYRHAGAGHVHLLLHQTPSRLMLEIVDDGRGLLPTQEYAASRAGHWGIAGMRERARAIGGRFTLTSAPAEGTSIRLEVRLRGSLRARGARWLRAAWASIGRGSRT